MLMLFGLESELPQGLPGMLLWGQVNIYWERTPGPAGACVPSTSCVLLRTKQMSLLKEMSPPEAGGKNWYLSVGDIVIEEI